MVNTIDREGFIFYRSFYDAINDLPEQEQYMLYKAIADFSFTLEEPKLSGVSSTIFKLIKPQIEANNRKYINGKKGAKKKQTESKQEANGKQTGSKRKAKEKEKEKENVKDKEKEKDNKDTLLIDFLKSVGLPEEKYNKIETWIPDDFLALYEEKVDNDKVAIEWEKFCNWFTSANAKRKKYADWKATWRNWITK